MLELSIMHKMGGITTIEYYEVHISTLQQVSSLLMFCRHVYTNCVT